MKKVIFIILVSIIFSYLTAQEFQIDKIGEIAYAQEFKSPEAIQIIDNHLFFLNLNGLEIYEINEDDSLTKLSIVTIPSPTSMVIYEQNCYIASRGYAVEGYPGRIYRIDISNTSDPEIIDQIEYDNYGYLRLKILDNNLVVQTSSYWNIFYKSYSLPEMGYLGQAVEDYFYDKVNDSLLVCQEGSILYIKHYIPHGNFVLIGTTDVSAYSDGNYNYEHYKVMNDTLLAAVNFKNITFWDISDVTNWQYLSRYTLPANIFMYGNYQYGIMNENVIIFTSDFIRLLDISDILNPILVDTLDFHYYWGGQACDSYENNLYVGTVTEGTMHYRIENNTIENLNSYYDHKRFFLGDMYQDKIFAGSLPGGYQLFDVQNPLEPIDQGSWFDDKYYRMAHKTGGWIILTDYEEYTLDIYDITDPENPELKNTLPLDDYGFSATYCSIDETDPFSFYLCNQQTNKFWKFDISEQGEPVEVFEYDLPSTPRDLEVINSTAYITIGDYPFNLLILDGIEENEPYIANEFISFSNVEYLDNQEDYLISFGLDQYEPGRVFHLEDPLNPILYFIPQFGSRIFIRDNLLFSQYWHIISVYEHNSSISDPLAIFNGLNYIYNVELIEHEGINYLLTIEMGNIGLFEYTYVPSSTEDELPIPEITLSNYPNPFNPETTILFSLTTEITEDTELTIYNIKGQKVKQLVSNSANQFSAGQHSVVWDGTDENNKPVSSGVYMYQLKVDGKAIASKKCLLLK